MTSIIVGIVIAMLIGIVYTVRAWTGAEKEKATLEKTSKVALDKIQILEKEKLDNERKLREAERHEEEVWEDDRGRTTVVFYPGVRPNSDPNDSN